MGSFFQMDDEALWVRVRDGDARAFEALYERHARKLLGFLFHFLKSKAEAEEVLHEVFLAVWEKKGDEECRSVKAWLYTVARNRALKRLRPVKQAEWQEAVGVESLLDDKRAERRLAQVTEDLPPALAEVYRLRVEGKGYEEVARVLGIPVGTVKSRMHALVNFLKERMKPWTVN